MCEICPRCCGANRAIGAVGYCGADDTLRVARSALHHWEEPPISGTRGSGTVFFSNCSLRCVFCQNAEISTGGLGQTITVERLAELFLELQQQGAHNINLVTPTHYQPQIIVALDLARAAGLQLPIIYNTSGYETVETIQLLTGYVDIYLTDFKYASRELAARYSKAPDYPQIAEAALQAMFEQVGEYSVDEGGMLRRGIIVRHLMMPDQRTDSQAVLDKLCARYGNSICYSLMNQYTPMPDVSQFPELCDTVDEREYSELIDYALNLGVTNSFMQEGDTVGESYIPPFDTLSNSAL
ncbi:MAG: radical SAM protein [Coriobacteriaceae bacterium]|nr:radical SAM protein [Coriobacteriaceae bacterium]